MVIILRVYRIFFYQLQLQVEGNRKHLYNTSRHLLTHTFLDTRHKIRIPNKYNAYVICLLSWFPLMRNILSGYLTLSASKRRKVSQLWYPLSTKSPINR